MNAREKILSAVARSQPGGILTYPASVPAITYDDRVGKFQEVIELIGGNVIPVSGWHQVIEYLNVNYNGRELMSPLHPLKNICHSEKFNDDPLSYANVEIAVLEGEFGVAENGAVWIQDNNAYHRAVPFICQHLALVVGKESIVNNMQEAYERLQSIDYSYGTFIAGPSKTADIEQSLVLGAHGPKTMTIFLF